MFCGHVTLSSEMGSLNYEENVGKLMFRSGLSTEFIEIGGGGSGGVEITCGEGNVKIDTSDIRCSILDRIWFVISFILFGKAKIKHKKTLKEILEDLYKDLY